MSFGNLAKIKTLFGNLANELGSRESFTEHLVDKVLKVFERVLVDDLEQIVEPLRRDDSGHLEHVPLCDLALLARAHPRSRVLIRE